MNFWMFWNSTKTKFKEIIRFIHISFFANLYYRFLNNIVGLIMLLILFFGLYLCYSYVKNKIIEINEFNVQKKIEINQNRDNFLKNLINDYKQNGSSLILSAEEDGILDLSSLALIGTIEKKLKGSVFNTDELKLEIINQTKLYEKNIEPKNGKYIIPNFNDVFGIVGYYDYFTQDEYFALFTFLKEKNIDDSNGLIKQLAENLKEDIDYKTFLEIKKRKLRY